MLLAERLKQATRQSFSTQAVHERRPRWCNCRRTQREVDARQM